jgi:hypothetical protein
MRSVRATLFVVVLAGFTAGCLSIKSYVDPFLPQVGYGDLLPRRDVRPAVLTVAFHRNGEPASLGTSRARDEIRTVFEKSKLFSAVTDKPTGDADQFDIVLDNRGDVGDAMAKGMLTGITFGGAGSRVTDGYVFTVKFQRAGAEPLTKVYRHAIHSTIGNAAEPQGIAPMSISEAFSKVVEGLVLNLLLDLQKEERL